MSMNTRALDSIASLDLTLPAILCLGIFLTLIAIGLAINRNNEGN